VVLSRGDPDAATLLPGRRRNPGCDDGLRERHLSAFFRFTTASLHGNHLSA